MYPANWTKGFTLLEILAAFIIFGVLGTSLFQLFQSGLQHIDRSANTSHAALLAQSKLTELNTLRKLAVGEYQGQFKNGYRWHLNLTPYTRENQQALPEASLQAYHATLRITWQPHGEYTLQTLLAVPVQP